MSKTPSLTQRTIRGLLTQGVLSVGLKLLTMAKTFVFARLFAPEDFGVFATAGMVVSFVMLFGEMGINQAVIRQKENPERLMDTALTLNLLVVCLFFVVIFSIAPLAAKIFRNPDLTLYIRFLSYSAFGGMVNLPGSLWDRELRFGMSNLPRYVVLVCGFLATVICVIYFHLGVWSLFVGGLVSFLINGIFVWIIAPYRPRFKFNRADAKALYSFGWPLLISSVLGFIVWKADDLMVRYFWGNEQLGYYTIAFYMPMYLSQIAEMTNGVLFPAFSKVQDATDKLDYAFRMSNRMLAVVSVPLGFGVCIFAPQIIHYFYSDKWLPALPLLQIFAAASTIRVITGYNWNILVISRGRTKEPMYGLLGLSLLTLTLGTYLIASHGALGGAIFNAISVIVWMIPFRLYIIQRELGHVKFLNGIWKPLLSGIVSATIAFYSLRAGSLQRLPLLMIPGAIFVLVYLIVLYALDREIIEDIKLIARVKGP